MNGSMGDDDDDNAMPPPPAAAYAPCLDPVAAVREFQAWRRGASLPSPHPTALGEAIDAVLARLETLEATQVWQPIETSPRTNRARLVYCPERLNTFLVTWRDTGDRFSARAREGHWVHFGTGSVLREEPTHWMPLPARPKESES